MTVEESYATDGLGGSWEWYSENEPAIPLREVRDEFDAVKRVQGEATAKLFRAAIKAKLDRAKQGRLEIPEDAKTAMRRARDLHEVRWNDFGKAWRLYFGQPSELSANRIMLGLRFHRKESAEKQDEEIDIAAERIDWWRTHCCG